MSGVVACVFLSVSCAVTFGLSRDFLQDFLIRDDLKDGEHEKRIFYDGIYAKELSVEVLQSSNENLLLREVSDGKRLVHMIYKQDAKTHALSLIDCDFTHDKEEVGSFLDDFVDDVREMDSSTKVVNVRYVSLTDISEMPSDALEGLLNFRKLKKECKSFHQLVRSALKRQRGTSKFLERPRGKRDLALSQLLIMPGTNWCGNENIAEEYSDLAGFHRVDKCCRAHDRCPNNIHGLSSKYGMYNSGLTTVSQCSCDHRKKRSIFQSLQIPHTKWCGVGYSATTYNELGGLNEIDNCCRQHDVKCLHFVGPFETKYGHTNYGIVTVSHCECDTRFRSCLHATRSPQANFVGAVFFDVVKAKCFDFKKEKVCKKRRWWSPTCEKWVWEDRAILRDPAPFKKKIHSKRWTRA